MKAVMALVAGLLLVPMGAPATVIDTFDTGFFYLSTSTGSPASLIQSGLPADAVLGGSRAISLTETGPLHAAAAISQTCYLSYSNDTDTRSTLTIEYGATAELNARLANEEAFRILVKTDSSALPPHRMYISLEIRTNGDDRFVAPPDSVASDSVFVDFIIPFSSFTGAGSPDWNDVDYIKLTLMSSSNATDAALDAFTAQIPEPTTLTILILALPGLIRPHRVNRRCRL